MTNASQLDLMKKMFKDKNAATCKLLRQGAPVVCYWP